MRWPWVALFCCLFTRQAPAQDFTQLFADTAELQTAFTLLREPGGKLWLGGTKLPLGGDDLQAWIYRLDASGNILRRFRFPFNGYQSWIGMDFIGGSRVGVMVSQRTSGGITENWLAILDTSQILSFQKIEGMDDIIVDDANATRSGCLLVCGFHPTSGPGGNDYWLGKVKPDATLEWVYDENLSPNDHIRQAKEAQDGSIYFSGDIQQQSYNPILGRLDSAGNELWFKVLQSPWNDGAQKFDFDSLGRVWLSGESSNSAGAMFDTQVSLIDTSGQLIWQQIIGGPGQDAAFQIQRGKNLRFWVAGYSNASTSGTGPISPFLMHLDENGNSLGEAFWPQSGPSPVYDFENVGDTAFYFCGVNNTQAYLMKRTSPALTNVFVVGNTKPGKHKGAAPLLVYLPESQLLKVKYGDLKINKLELLNTLGQNFTPILTNPDVISLHSYPSGVYWVVVNGENGERIGIGKILR